MKPKQKSFFSGIKQKRKIAREILTESHSITNEKLLKFEFVTEKKLHKKIITAYREAIFVNSLTKVLYINRSDSYPLNEIQIINYASICEAILGYIFKTNKTLTQSNSKDKLGKLLEMNIITTELDKEVRSLWETRNNIHLHKAKITNEKFFKKNLTDLNNTIIEFCISIQKFLNKNSQTTVIN